MLGMYLSEAEITCKCGCGLSKLSQDIVVLFNAIREMYNRPLKISSGCRCKDWNIKQGGADSSAHTPDEQGICHALDIRLNSSADRFKVMQYALSLGINRIGLHKDFIHIDTRKTLPQGVAWFY